MQKPYSGSMTNVIKAYLKKSLLLKIQNDWLAEELLKIERNNIIHPFFQWMFRNDDRRKAEKLVADKINHITKKNEENVIHLRIK